MAISPLAWAKFRAVTGLSGVGPLCLFRKITGTPCPFCFGTRSWVHIMGGDVFAGFAANPLGGALLFLDVMVVIYFAVAIFLKSAQLPIQAWMNKKLVLFPLLAIIIANWIYVVIHFHIYNYR